MKRLILVTGSDGLVGSRFIELTNRKNFLHLPTQVEFDITQPERIREVIKDYKFSAIVNFAAYTNVSEAEKERDNRNGDCWQVNVEGVKNLVNAIDPDKIHYIQISTDMVFSGSDNDPGPYPEHHPAETDSEKLTWYGFTKAEAERYVLEQLGNKATIIRINNPVRAKYETKLDYARKPLKLYDEGKLYPLFTDQKVTVTFIDEFAKLVDKIINENITGIMHLSSSDLTSPYEFVSYLLERTRKVEGVVKSTTIEDYWQQTQLPLRYPKNGGLQVFVTEKILNHRFLSWREIVDELVAQGITP